ncbi:EAL domain-containing protein [Thiotrichales bacterium HSG1]|nr:EAL domain-containing protein [Thiotrichales bacterium HSG1]
MSGNILYIEDDIVTAAYVQTQLEQHGYIVDVAADGKEGLSKITQGDYDVVAVDYHLPDMSGLRILESLADNFKTSTIMITGAGDEKIAVEAMKLGASDYLIKDINHDFIELLPTIIESEIEKQQLLIAKYQAEKASRYRDNILEAVSFAAENFLTCSKWSQPIPEVLSRLGRTMSISRVYISENHYDKKGVLLSSTRYEWVASNIKPQINLTQNFPYFPHLEFLTKILSQGQVFHGSVQNFPKSISELFIVREIRSIAIVPLFVGKKWWGYIGYDNCVKEQEWLPIIIEAFKTAANILGAAIQHEQMNQALRNSESRLSETQKIAKLGQCDWDICNNTRYLSEETLKILNWPLDKHIVSNDEFLNAIHPEDRQMVKNSVSQAIHFDKSYDIEFRIIRPDNSVRYLHVISKLFRSDNGKPIRFLSTTQDITERKISEKKLEENTQTLSAILNAATDSIIMMELDTTCVIINPAGAARLGISADKIIGKPICDLVAPQIVPKRKKMLRQIVKDQQPVRFEESDKNNIWYDHSIYPVFNEHGDVTRIAMVSRNITKRKQDEELIWHQAHHDALTNLPNRALFVERLSQAIQFAKQRKEKLAVMFVDLDRFKQVNDTLGHRVGDILLQEVSKRLQQEVREFDTVARLGGDEFTIIINDFDEYLCVKNIAERLLHSLSNSFFIVEHKISIAGSIGIALFPSDGQDVETLLKNADVAMYQVKESGRNSYQFFTHQMNTQLIEHTLLEDSLCNALKRDEFKLCYQPIIGLKSEKLVAIGTSLRWQNSESMFPEQFLGSAEKYGLVVSILKWWLSTAIQQLQKLQSNNLDYLQISVKLSAYQLKTNDIAEIIQEALQKFNLSPNHLILEIDEEAFLKNLPETANNLAKLENLGTQIAIDNFGSNWGSLHTLRQLPIDIIKIDPFFIHNITADNYDTILIQTIIALAHKLNIKVIGCGLETKEQLNFLQDHKCDFIQGCYITNQLNYENLVKFIKIKHYLN